MGEHKIDRKYSNCQAMQYTLLDSSSYSRRNKFRTPTPLNHSIFKFMNHDIFCPQCGSDDISTSHKRQLQRCADCQHEWPLVAPPPDLPYVSLSNVTSEPVRQFCKNLAATAQWVATVENDWPAPIAHEYYRLRELLAEGQLVSAIWQLKDVAEILIKFPAIVMAQTVLSSPALLPSPSGRGAGGEGRGAGGEGRGAGGEGRGAGGEGNLVEQVQATLLAKPLSMGDWHRLAGDILALAARGGGFAAMPLS